MINKTFQGPFLYREDIISGWDSNIKGIYYCGIKQNESIIPLYIGKATREGGIKDRLLDHLREDNWPDITHFAYYALDNEKEIDNFEVLEIEKYKPKYNIQNK